MNQEKPSILFISEPKSKFGDQLKEALNNGLTIQATSIHYEMDPKHGFCASLFLIDQGQPMYPQRLEGAEVIFEKNGFKLKEKILEMNKSGWGIMANSIFPMIDIINGYACIMLKFSPVQIVKK